MKKIFTTFSSLAILLSCVKNLKKLFVLFIALTLYVSTLSFVMTAQAEGISTGAFTEADFLKTNGKYIRNNAGNGNVVYLRGTNAGGWLVQESWMNPVNASCQQVILDTFESRFGKTVRDELIDIYEDNYWTEADFDNCAELGMSVIRLPFWYRDFLDDNNNLKADAFDRIDWFVENAAERGIYVILDMHGAPGSQNGSDHSGVDGGSDKIGASKFFFGSTASSNQELYYSLWETIAAHYKGNPAVAGYDLLNEPYCTYRYNSGYSDSELHTILWNIYDVAYDRIRAIDPDHIIIMEATWNPVDLPNPTTYGWKNIVYEYHNYLYDDYDNANGNQISNMQSKINSINSANYDVPSYMGEFCYFNNSSAWSTGLELLNNSNLHWTSWSYKVLSSYGNWGIYNHNPSSVDIYNDSADTIRQKWSTVGSSWANTNTYSIFKQNLPGTISDTTSFNGQNYIGLQSEYNSKFACAEDYGNAPLVADRDSAGGWEQFLMIENSDGTVSLMSNANGKYICAVIDENNQLVARSNKISTWEKFTLTDLGNGKYALLAGANSKYVAVDYSDGVLKATDSAVTTASTFNIVQSDKISYTIAQADKPEPIIVPATFNATAYISKSSEITNNTTYVGNLANGSYLDYLISVPETGNYTISLMAAAGNSNSDRVISVYSGDTLLNTIPVFNSTDWFTYSELKNGIALEKGVQTIRLSSSGSVNISDIIIAKAPDTYTIPCTVNASDYMSAEGVVVVDGDTVKEFGYNDKTFYTVNVPETGEYKLTLTTAAEADAKVHIDTNLSGDYAWVNSVDLPNTGSLATFADTEATLNLTEGVQTLKFVVQTAFDFKGFTLEKVQQEEEIKIYTVLKIGSDEAYDSYYDATYSTGRECIISSTGKALLPLRALAMMTYSQIEYDEATDTITLVNRYGAEMTMKPNSTEFTMSFNGIVETGTINAPQIIGTVTYLPVRDVSMMTGVNIEYLETATGEYVVLAWSEMSDAEYLAATEKAQSMMTK